jgi:hypothetical protein
LESTGEKLSLKAFFIQEMKNKVNLLYRVNGLVEEGPESQGKSVLRDKLSEEDFNH